MRAIKVALFLLCLLPLGKLVLETLGVAGLSLGANPIEELLHRLGKWGLNLLFVTLTVTPLRRWANLGWLVGFRRMLGLFAFFYIALHFLVYALLDQRLDPRAVVEDIVERPYITLGVAALILLMALAMTSTSGMMRRLGRRWKQLHQLIYPIAILGVWHFYWQVKEDVLEPLIYAGVLLFLFSVRVWYRWRRRRSLGSSQKLTAGLSPQASIAQRAPH